MITKTKLWKSIIKEMKIMEDSKKVTARIMETIRQIPQDENNNKRT